MRYLHLILVFLLSVVAITGCDKLEYIFGRDKDKVEENAQLYYVKNDMEGMDLITDNVNRIFYIGTDSLTHDIVIKGGKMDLSSNELIREETFVVYVDSLERFTSILIDGCMCIFDNYTETSCDIAFINEEGTYEYVENIPFKQTKSSYNRTKSESGEAIIDGTVKVISGVKSSLELALSICKNPKSLNTAFKAFDYLSGLFSGGISVAMNGASMGLQAKLMNVRPDLFSLCIWLIEMGRTLSDSLTERLIGNWDLEFISVEQVDINTAEIVFSIYGIKDNPSVKLSGSVWYMNTDNRDGNAIPFNVQNKTYRLSIPLNSYGSYSGNISINGSFGFLKRKVFNFDAFYLGIRNVTIEDNPLFKDGSVNFRLYINLEGSDDGLKEISQLGYYTRYSNNAYLDYKQVSHLSTIFESTPLTYTLPIESEGFFDKNYNTFEAKATGYYIGTYVVLKNGNIVTFNEQEIQGLVYKEKPSITFTSASITGNTVTEYYEDGMAKRYQTDFTFDLDVKGAFWFNTIQFQILPDNWTNEWGSETISEDGSYTRNGSLFYGRNASMSAMNYYQMNMHDGSTKNSTNCLIFSGSPGNPYISIGGYPAYAPSKVPSRNRMSKDSIASPSFKSAEKKQQDY